MAKQMRPRYRIDAPAASPLAGRPPLSDQFLVRGLHKADIPTSSKQARSYRPLAR